MMNKIRRTIIFAILFATVFSLCSCSTRGGEKLYKIPYTSARFSQEFMDQFDSKYRLYDNNLYYLSANLFEVRTSDYSGVFKYDVDTLLISTIENVPRDEFVAVTHRGQQPIMGGRHYYSHVYQTNYAPVPMRDYTISSVSIIGWKLPPYWYVGSGSSNFNKIMDQAPNYFETFLESRRTAIVAEYTYDGHPEFIESLKNGYSNSTADKAICLTTHNIYRIDEGDPNHENTVYYSLLFRFEETDNLVWYVPIVKNRSTEEWYYSFGYYEYVPYTQSGGREYLRYEEVEYHAPISEEAKTIIREAIKYELH